MSKPARVKHHTTDWTEYNAALKRRRSVMVWLDADLQWQASPSDRNEPHVCDFAVVDSNRSNCPSVYFGRWPTAKDTIRLHAVS